MSGDFPSISASTYASQTYGGLGAQDATGSTFFNLTGGSVGALGAIGAARAEPIAKQLVRGRRLPVHPATDNTEEAGTIMAITPARRLVQVFIADPNENVPLEQSLLYRGEQKLTDATDQELYFEIDIKDILAKHNEARVKMVDKAVKERTEYLEPARVRDLKMVVTTIATF